MLKFHYFLRRNKTPALLVGLLFLGVILFLSSRITLEEDISRLIPSGEQQDFLKNVLEQTSFNDKIAVAISSTSGEANPDELTQYANQFIDSVSLTLPGYVEDIQGKVPEESVLEMYDFVYNNLPLFLNEEDYLEIEKRLQPENLRDRLEDNYKILISPAGLVTKAYLFKDPLSINTLGLQKLEQLRTVDEFKLYNDFLITADHQHVLLFISPRFPPSEINKNREFIEKLQKIQSNLNEQFERAEGEFFGEVIYSVANANQIKKDIALTLGVAFGILFLLLVYYYKTLLTPFILFVPSVLGGLTALALLYIFQQNISGISLGIGAVLLGISIDYSFHVLTHYRENNNLEKLYNEITKPVMISSSTTAVAFLCLLMIQSKVLNDLAIFAAISLVLAAVFALVLIPLLYTGSKPDIRKNSFIDMTAGLEFHNHRSAFIFLLLLFICGLFLFTKVDFNTDLSALSYEPEELRQTEKNVEEITGAENTIDLVSYGNTVDEALEKNNELYQELNDLESRGEIEDFNSIGGVVLSTSTQLEKIAEWRSFWTPERQGRVRNNLIRHSEEFGFRPHSFEEFYELLSKDFDPIYLEDYRDTYTLYLDDFISSDEGLATVATSVEVRENQEREIKERFKNEDNVLVIDQEEIDETFLGNIKNDFNRLSIITALAVFILLLIFYRSLIISVLTFLPIAVSFVISLGLMAVLNLQFNIVNLIIASFIFGLGLDYSIFMTNAFLKEYETGVRVLKVYRTSIILSVITTLFGIGALFFAEHPALESISGVSIIGILSAVFVVFIGQGFLLNTLFIKRSEAGKPAFSLGRFFRFSGRKAQQEKLYYKVAVLNNYRYKSVFSEVKQDFENERDRFFRVSEFLEANDKVLHCGSGYGILPIYLYYKNSEIRITGIETNLDRFRVAQNCPASRSERLEFSTAIPEDDKDLNVFIISADLQGDQKKQFQKMVGRQAKTVIILDPEISSRWLIDLNFEISYRQNQVLVLQK